MTRPRRGEVWRVDLEPTVGDEMGKTRPVVVVSEDDLGALAVKLVAPVTSVGPAKLGKAWLVPVRATKASGLKHDGLVGALQVRGVSLRRFKQRAGRLSEEDMAEVAAAIGLVVGLE